MNSSLFEQFFIEKRTFWGIVYGNSDYLYVRITPSGVTRWTKYVKELEAPDESGVKMKMPQKAKLFLEELQDLHYKNVHTYPEIMARHGRIFKHPEYILLSKSYASKELYVLLHIKEIKIAISSHSTYEPIPCFQIFVSTNYAAVARLGRDALRIGELGTDGRYLYIAKAPSREAERKGKSCMDCHLFLSRRCVFPECESSKTLDREDHVYQFADHNSMKEFVFESDNEKNIARLREWNYPTGTKV